jgi:NitT/TauT family transport system permease protein
MVMPIIFQNVLAGLDSIDKELIEVTRVFKFTLSKKLKILVFPSLRSYLFPAIITSVGLAFKSQIAAEIIAYTKNSIGQYIYDANYGLNTDVVFAWAVVIVSFSITLEAACRLLLRRLKG